MVTRRQRAPQNPPSPRQEVQLHRFLGGQRGPTAIWDVSQRFLTARRFTSQKSIEKVTPHFLSMPATNPPLTKMRILCESFPWDVNIHLPPQAPEKFITIGIVLDSIHGILHEPMDPEAWQETCPAEKRKIYKAMCSRLAKSPPSIKADGRVWKIDCLLDRTMFLGLRPGGPNPDEWILSLGPARLD